MKVSLIHFTAYEINNIIIMCRLFGLGLECVSSTASYEEMNTKVEKWCRIVIILYLALIQSFMFAIFLLSYYQYYTTNLGSGAFMLPTPCWYVLKSGYKISRHILSLHIT